jgi:hypothetical protein
MKKSELKSTAAHYTKIVEWSDEDGCFVGSAPPWIALLEGDGQTLPEPLAQKKFSGKFVLRLEPAIHRRLAAKALAAGESLNTYCVKALVKA